ncbi:MFS transporter [Microbulbifer sp. MLAF003]|uniref:MFS transporter n=1 Tax=unclassified Microbulbifer TaxID=2619833 RepID=UPI0024ADD468|nr:MFS transporter [Microbulbifer sp. MLAF003]WHI52860.1 MFS transporter [Microbulbifer sp. MLAF003]
MSYFQMTLSKSQKLGFLAVNLALFLVTVDFTAFSPAIPAIEQEFNIDITTSQWIINGYGLMFGVLIVTGGRLADIYGRRRLFFIGSTIFLLFSLIGGLSFNTPTLLISRIVIGAGAALMWPSILGIAYTLVPPSRAGQVGGLVMTVCGLANAIGPILGGTLSDLWGWRWIFLINIPLTLLSVFLCWKFVPQDTPTKSSVRVDYAGVIMLMVSVFSLLFGMYVAAEIGFNRLYTLYFFFVFFVSLVIFLFLEVKKGRDALIPGDVITNAKFTVVGAISFVTSVVFFSVILYLPQYSSKVLGFSALDSGLALLPLMISFVFISFLSGRVYLSLGPKLIICVGIFLMGAGMASLSAISGESRYIDVVPGLVLLGLGLGLFNPAATTLVVTIVEPGRESLASAILFMFKVAGGALGLGLNAVVVAFAPDMISGIGRAFLLNAFLVFASLIVGVFFIARGTPESRVE